MLSFSPSLGAILLMTISQVKGQTFTDCNPLQRSCPPNPGLGTSVFTDFTKGISDYWKPLQGTTLGNSPEAGLQFSIKSSTDAPTMVLTKYIMFGRVEMVAKSSPGRGIVSSFVLLSQDLDEIDWEWLGGDNNNVQTNFFGKGDTSSYDRGVTIPVQTPIDTFHKYSIDWTSDRIIWEIDGKPVRTVAYNDPLTKGGSIYPQTPMQVKVGNWIGCLDASNPATSGTCSWAGGQADLSKGPFTMSVQSINVTDFGCGGDYIYSDNSGSFKSIKSTGACDGKGTGPGTQTQPQTDSKPGNGPGFAPGTSNTTKPAPSAAVPLPSSASTVPLKPQASDVSFPNPKATGAPINPGLPNNNSTTLPKDQSGSTGSINPSPNNTAGINFPVENTSDANKTSKHKFGTAEIVVGILGLGLGYLVM